MGGGYCECMSGDKQEDKHKKQERKLRKSWAAEQTTWWRSSQTILIGVYAERGDFVLLLVNDGGDGAMFQACRLEASLNEAG